MDDKTRQELIELVDLVIQLTKRVEALESWIGLSQGDFNLPQATCCDLHEPSVWNCTITGVKPIEENRDDSR